MIRTLKHCTKVLRWMMVQHRKRALLMGENKTYAKRDGIILAWEKGVYQIFWDRKYRKKTILEWVVWVVPIYLSATLTGAFYLYSFRRNNLGSVTRITVLEQNHISRLRFGLPKLFRQIRLKTSRSPRRGIKKNVSKSIRTKVFNHLKCIFVNHGILLSVITH